MDEQQSINVFRELKSVMASYSAPMECSEDSSDCYNLFTRHIQDNGKALYFGGIKINKNFVSYHLMPIYVFPELTLSMDPELKKHLKGKSCFNFKTLNASQLKQLKILTERCFNKYKSEGYLDSNTPIID